ncbi:MAG: TetR/AcrR family transcriptional regulator [Eubacteriales bacterium]|nr:TetR/AcrR family transcriptional regulator [Eubacteriales bacterium]
MPKRPLPENINDQMMDAVVHISATRGIGRVTTLRVAEACGVAEITVYRHFTSKENLLYQTFTRFDKQVANAIIKDTREGIDFAVRIKNAWLKLFDYLVQRKAELSYYNQYIQSPLYSIDKDPRLDGACEKMYSIALEGNPTLAGMLGMGPEIVWTYTVQATMIFAEKISKGEIKDSTHVREYIFYLLFGQIVSGLSTKAAFAKKKYPPDNRGIFSM